MRVLVIGSGGREHAICWKIKQSTLLTALYCAPRKSGTAELAENISIPADDIEGLFKFAKNNRIDLTIVGPELPLSLGVVDRFLMDGIRIFGPTRAAAQLESSKSFAKEVMVASRVDTAFAETVYDINSAHDALHRSGVPIVLKADGLASGKGVFVCMTKDEAQTAVKRLFLEFKSEKVLIEEYLEGVEVSFIAVCSGDTVVPLATSHDYKRLLDNDKGPNTGGMGTVSPTPRISKEAESGVISGIIYPVLKEMKKRGAPFAGFLYAGLMICKDGSIKVLEFNTRLGDPECQSIMVRMEGDFLKLLTDLSDSKGECAPAIKWKRESAVCVVLASKGYPDSPKKGDPISGIHDAGTIPNVYVFHAGTAMDEGDIVTAGGRVLNIVALGDGIAGAISQAYKGCDMIRFEGMQYRRDIGIR